jgi:hypothetical protein
MTDRDKPAAAPLTDQQVREMVRVNAGTMSRIACGYLVHGPLDLRHLRTAFATVVSQHSALRTAVVCADDADFQLVLPQIEPPLFELDGLPPEVTVRGMVDYVEERIGRNQIRLNHGPMWWVCVVRLAPSSHVLVGMTSRLVMDFASIAMMFRCVLSSYLLQGRFTQPTPPAQYLSYSIAQQAWREQARETWIDRWRQRVDLEMEVSSRGLFPAPPLGGRELATDMFEVPPELASRLRRLADQQGCDLLKVMTAALALAERAEQGRGEHRIVVSHPGRFGNEDRAIGAYQVNGLLAFRTSEGDDLPAALNKVMEAWRFLEQNLGTGVESLLEGLVERRGGPVPIPFRMSLHHGEPPPAPEVPRGSNLTIDILPNLAERMAPLDPYAEGSILFVIGGERDAIMLSWWDDSAIAPFFAGLADRFAEILQSGLSARPAL